jgi:hypothetical protein
MGNGEWEKGGAEERRGAGRGHYGPKSELLRTLAGLQFIFQAPSSKLQAPGALKHPFRPLHRDKSAQAPPRRITSMPSGPNPDGRPHGPLGATGAACRGRDWRQQTRCRSTLCVAFARGNGINLLPCSILAACVPTRHAKGSKQSCAMPPYLPQPVATAHRGCMWTSLPSMPSPRYIVHSTSALLHARQISVGGGGGGDRGRREVGEGQLAMSHEP